MKLLSDPATGTRCRYVKIRMPCVRRSARWGPPPPIACSQVPTATDLLWFHRASSVLQRNTKLYGPKNALDLESDSTCWNSEGIEGSSSHYFELDFLQPIRLQELRLQFQAGFVARSCRVHVTQEGQFEEVHTAEFDDVHAVQSRRVATVTASRVRLVFEDFTDFYGRIIVYRLEVWGEIVGET